MSSKEQFKGALTRQKKVMVELRLKNEELQKALNRANESILEFKRSVIYKKKWWQFWK